MELVALFIKTVVYNRYKVIRQLDLHICHCSITLRRVEIK
jgi:hypothetical protein